MNKRKSFSGYLVSFIDAISLFSNRLAIFALAFMVVLITVDVIGRYFFSKPTYLADELSGYSLVAVIFLGLAHTQKLGRHVTSGIIETLLSASKLRWLDLITSLLSLLFIGWFTWNSALAAHQSYILGTATQTYLHTPYWIPQLFLPIGLSLFTFQLIVHVVRCFVSLRKAGAAMESGGKAAQ